MGKILFLESVAGIAGDMFAAAFVDAGLVSAEELNQLPSKLGLDGVSIEIQNVTRTTLRATNLAVKSEGTSSTQNHELHLDLGNPRHHLHTHYREIVERIENSSFADGVKTLAGKIFHILAEAEADAHGIAIEKVAFHEIGTVDSLLDVVMAAHCIDKVNADKIFATAIKPGRGMITMQHGTHPIPPPASIRLLKGMPTASTPEAITRDNIELSTPTGIAILKSLEPIFVNELPSGILLAHGMGSGTLDLGNFPNVFRVSLLEMASPTAELPYETDTVVEIACNIDDDTAEHIAWMTLEILKAGALDVWQTPATGKKGRVTICLSILAAEEDWKRLADWLLRNSTTFGIRYRKWNRLKLARHFEERKNGTGMVRFKIGSTTSNEIVKEKAEFDDMAGKATS